MRSSCRPPLADGLCRLELRPICRSRYHQSVPRESYRVTELVSALWEALSKMGFVSRYMRSSCRPPRAGGLCLLELRPICKTAQHHSGSRQLGPSSAEQLISRVPVSAGDSPRWQHDHLADTSGAACRPPLADGLCLPGAAPHVQQHADGFQVKHGALEACLSVEQRLMREDGARVVGTLSSSLHASTW